jgi:hypothetical protein
MDIEKESLDNSNGFKEAAELATRFAIVLYSVGVMQLFLLKDQARWDREKSLIWPPSMRGMERDSTA